MTRINVVDPSELMDQHLLAEYREIRLLTANLQRTLNSKHGFVESKVPIKFTLNGGHVYFFYNKGKYLHERYDAIRAEMRKRGISAELEFPVSKWPRELYKDWTPTEEARNIVRERIALRISQRPNWYRYYGKVQE
jgi:deoxyribonuclease (pyrimidine dimer)